MPFEKPQSIENSVRKGYNDDGKSDCGFIQDETHFLTYPHLEEHRGCHRS